MDEQSEETTKGETIMKKTQPNPMRDLKDNFTEQTLRRSVLARHHMMRRRQLKGLISMKIAVLKKPIGAFIALAFVVTVSVGVYAAANWFNGNVSVLSDNSVMSVDLSQCQSKLPPGVADNTDSKKVQFKIVGEPHVDSSVLQKKLLIGCELDSVVAFYANQPASKSDSHISSEVRTIGDHTVTLAVAFGGKQYDKTFILSPDATFYNKGQQTALKDVHVGDNVVFTYNFDASNWAESEDPLNEVSTIKSIFVTQYDTRQAPENSKNFYVQNNIMPVDLYNSMQNK